MRVEKDFLWFGWGQESPQYAGENRVDICTVEFRHIETGR